MEKNQQKQQEFEKKKRLQVAQQRKAAEMKQLEIENNQLAELESRLDALLLNADSTSQTPPAAGSN